MKIGWSDCEGFFDHGEGGESPDTFLLRQCHSLTLWKQGRYSSRLVMTVGDRGQGPAAKKMIGCFEAEQRRLDR